MSKLYVVLSVVAITVSGLFADLRHFVWTYEYMTMHKGKTELELYQTLQWAVPKRSELKLELEHGITDRLDVALYQVLKQTQGSVLVWSAMQLRFRYRFAERGTLPVNPEIYFEYARSLTADDNKFESKIILDKSLGPVIIALNPVYELVLGADDPEHELGVDAGVSVATCGAVSLGVESTTRIEVGDDEAGTVSYIGPTVAFRSGNLWAATGLGAGISDNADKMKVRLIVGVLF